MKGLNLLTQQNTFPSEEKKTLGLDHQNTRNEIAKQHFRNGMEESSSISKVRTHEYIYKNNNLTTVYKTSGEEKKGKDLQANSSSNKYHHQLTKQSSQQISKTTKTLGKKETTQSGKVELGPKPSLPSSDRQDSVLDKVTVRPDVVKSLNNRQGLVTVPCVRNSAVIIQQCVIAKLEQQFG